MTGKDDLWYYWVAWHPDRLYVPGNGGYRWDPRTEDPSGRNLEILPNKFWIDWHDSSSKERDWAYSLIVYPEGWL